MPLIRRLGVLAALLVTAAAWSGTALAAGEPANTALPTIDGRPQPGQTLAADRGLWTGSPTSYAFQWQRCHGGNGCLDIPGATASTYLISAADGGDTFDVVVTATNGAGDGKATSKPSYVVTTFSLYTPHFVVHYVTDPLAAGAITETQAGDVGALAERAYAAEVADGYPPPVADGTAGGDSRTDIYVADIDAVGVLGYAYPETASAQFSGYIVLNGADPLDSLTQHTIAHELFHLVQFGIWLPSSLTDHWLLEGSAEWMGYRVDGFKGGLDLGNWDMALDCRDPVLGNGKCDLIDDYKNNGYSRWPFFEFLAERWGADFTRSVFAQGGAAGGTAVNALSNAIAAKGSSLGDVFTDWTVANMTGGYTVAALQNVPVPAYATMSTGTLASLNAKTKQGAPLLTSGQPAPVKVSVNHFSARYVAIRPGDASLPDGPCYKATLDLSVALPSGVAARPYFWWSQKGPDGTNLQSAQALSVSGNTASISLPWDTCDWGGTQGYLSLPNPTANLDAQDFTITGTLTVDRSTQATSTPPPDPVSTYGPTTDVSGTGDVPRIQVFGPQLIRLSSASRVLRLIVSSSDSGALNASLGSLALGSAKLRAGSNDVRFALPPAAVGSLRKTAAVANSLTLTPVSASGAAGASVVRRVTFSPAAKPKPKAKHHAPKPHAQKRKA